MESVMADQINKTIRQVMTRETFRSYLPLYNSIHLETLGIRFKNELGTKRNRNSHKLLRFFEFIQ